MPEQSQSRYRHTSGCCGCIRLGRWGVAWVAVEGQGSSAEGEGEGEAGGEQAGEREV